jgi:hypothetical protein
VALRNDADVVSEAVQRNGFALQYASDALADTCVTRLLHLLLLPSPHLFRRRDIALKAVTSHGGALRFVSINMADNDEVVLAAVSEVITPAPVLFCFVCSFKNVKVRCSHESLAFSRTEWRWNSRRRD